MRIITFLLAFLFIACASSADSPLELPATLSQSEAAPANSRSRPKNGLVAYSTVDRNGRHQIFTVTSSGDGRRQLTTEGNNLYPWWTRDGTRLVFSSDRRGRYSLHTMLADGTQQTSLHHSFIDAFLGQYSPDQSLLAYIGVAGGIPEIFLLDPSSGVSKQLTTTPFQASQPVNGSFLPRFLPDGQSLIHSSSRGGSMQLWTMDLEGANQRQLSGPNGADFPDSNAPALSFDGTRLAFWSGFEAQHGEIFVVDMDGSKPVQLTDEPGGINSDNPSWSPDGQKILFDTNRDGRVNIWVMDADGSDQQRFIDEPQSSQFSWQPVFD